MISVNLDIKKYVGNVLTGARIEDSTGFDVLNRDIAFLNVKFAIVLDDGNRVDLAASEYLEFKNSPSGRKRLDEADIDEKYKTTILTIWGTEPTLSDEQ